MPRKSASHAAKKDAGGETKSDASTPRRSGRAVTKSESSSGREAASRSRRGSTAAQTVASVADSKGSKGSRNSVGSSRDSTSPSDNRGRSRKEGSETPATRVKGARRNASRINYKESDGEEEAPAPKNDELFDSNEEFEESDSDEKSKPKGRAAKVAKPAAKAVGGKKARASGGRSRRGRQVKKKGAKSDDEESDHETFDVSEDSGDVAEAAPAKPAKKAKTTPAKPRESASKRGRKIKATPEPVAEEKSKPSRRSSRAAVSKEDTPSIKRPSRSVQAKKYTEEDDEEIEELSDSKAADEEEEEKPEQVSSRKRKRNSATEANKRLKEDAAAEKKKEVEVDDDNDDVVDDANVKSDEKDEDKKPEPSKEDAEESDSEEAMEVDESDSVAGNEKSEKPEEKKVCNFEELTEEKKVETPKEQDASISKTNAIPGEKTTDEHFDDSASDSEQESKADQSVSSGVEDSQDSQDVPKDKTPTKVDNSVLEKKKIETNAVIFDKLDKKSEDTAKESNPVEIHQKNDLEVKTTDSFPIEKSKPESSNPELNVTHSKEQNADAALNGSEQTPPATNVTHVIHPASSVIFEHKDNAAPKANGEHDSLHNNATATTDDQNYPFPGRKYIINPKLSENTRNFVKDKTFSILSYNLGESSPEAYVQKDKLLHELDKLQSHVICLQQVAKSLYEVLEPSLDALGFKGVYSQPEETTKGLATFYKSSLFKAVRFSESSIKKFVDKELEVSTMDSTDKGAVVSHTNVKKYGNVLFTHLNSVIGSHTLTVANVQIPLSEISIQALQVSCLAREVASLVEGANKTYVLCGEFNMKEGEAPYQLLRDGYLSNDMIEELQQRKDVVLPGKENAALINLLWKAFQHPSSNLCSSYASVLDRELSIPEKLTTSPDLLWFSSDSLHTVGVLDVVASKPPDTATTHFSLKADIAFSV